MGDEGSHKLGRMEQETCVGTQQAVGVTGHMGWKGRWPWMCQSPPPFCLSGGPWTHGIGIGIGIGHWSLIRRHRRRRKLHLNEQPAGPASCALRPGNGWVVADWHHPAVVDRSQTLTIVFLFSKVYL